MTAGALWLLLVLGEGAAPMPLALMSSREACEGVGQLVAAGWGVFVQCVELQPGRPA